MSNNSPVHFIREFLGQKVPDARNEEMPIYYRKALGIFNVMTGILFLIILVLNAVNHHQGYWMPLFLLVCLAVKIYYMDKMSMPANLRVHTVITVLWCSWYVYTFGWTSGGQHFLIPLLILIFFSVYVKPTEKILYFLLLIAVRMLLFSYSQNHEPVIVLSAGESLFYQTTNSLFLFIIMALDCIVFSTSIQATERQLLIANQELHKEAETDPLTQLPNRRSLIEEMTVFRKTMPEAQFCIAIADIDFFKRVNDTYGHACGDYSLQVLSKCFSDEANGRYWCGRWGGEEFCFFFPNLNLDEAGDIMRDVSIKVGYLDIEYEGNNIHITITAGVEENDFRSDLDVIIEQADKKLYLGKASGRNCVIV